MNKGWTDIRNADVTLAAGGNPAENHPVVDELAAVPLDVWAVERGMSQCSRTRWG